MEAVSWLCESISDSSLVAVTDGSYIRELFISHSVFGSLCPGMLQRPRTHCGDILGGIVGG
jgi:hypothetical protein